MTNPLRSTLRASGAYTIVLFLAGYCHALTGYGVNSQGTLFHFDVDNPNNSAVAVGPVGFVPEGIDFRPSSSTLYAIDIGPNTTQLYTININTALATPIGAGFPSTSASYNLTGNQHFGFDVNPSTLQMDGSIRIRLTATNSDNLRLHSATGAIAAEDTDLLIPPSSSPFVDGSAYSNNIANMATLATTLYDMDSRNDKLYIQNPPNNGTLTEVGPFGVTIDALVGIGFDIDTNPGTLANRGLAVYQRTDTAGGAYLIYDVNLATGATTMGALVGPAATVIDFNGGFSVLPVPEPSTLVLAGLALVPLVLRWRPWSKSRQLNGAARE